MGRLHMSAGGDINSDGNCLSSASESIGKHQGGKFESGVSLGLNKESQDSLIGTASKLSSC